MLAQYMAELAQHEAEESSGDDEEHSDDDAEEEEDVEADEGEEANPEAGPSSDVERIAPSADEPTLESLSLQESTTEKEEQEEGDEEENSEEDSDDDSDLDSLADAGAHRRHRPSAKRVERDVSSIVQNKLAKAKTSTERKHHGKKPVTANILGRQKGSKKKQDSRRAIKDANTF